MSDIDLQSPKFTHDFHDAVNRALGLPVSDTFWVHAPSVIEAVSVFDGFAFRRDLADSQSLVLWDILELWSKGTLDHLHSWSNDGVPVLRVVPQAPIPVTGDGSIVEFDAEAVDAEFLPEQYRYAVVEVHGKAASHWALDYRLNGIWSSLPVSHFSIYVPDDTKRFVTFDFASVLGQGWTMPELEAVRIHNGPCGSDGVVCSGTVAQVDLVGFGREMVRKQSDAMRQYGLTPAISTSHGGVTGHNAYTNKTLSGTGIHTHNSWLKGKRALRTYEPHANVSTEHPFHLDLLKDLGVRYLWPLDSRQPSIQNSGSTLARLPKVDGIGYFYRHGIVRDQDPSSPVSGDADWGYAGKFDNDSDVDDFFTSLLGSAPDATVFCGPSCDSSQGDALPLLLWAKNNVANSSDEALVYTHFGSGSGDFRPADTLRPVMLDEFERLAAAHYGFPWHDGAETKRSFYLTPLSFLTGQTLSATAAISYNKGENSITLNENGPGIDLETILPDLHDRLHGLTLRLDEAHDGTFPEINFNDQTVSWLHVPKHQSAREATILANGPGFEFLSVLPLAIEQTDGPRLGYRAPADEGDAHRFELTDTAGSACVAYSYMSLLNINHVLVELAEAPPEDMDWAVEMHFADGEGLVVANHAGKGADAALSQIDVSGVEPVLVEERVRYALPLYVADWGREMPRVSRDIIETAGAPADFVTMRPSLPVGKLDKLCVRLSGRSGDGIELNRLTLVRNPAAAVDQDENGALVLGRLTSTGPETAISALEISRENGDRTAVTVSPTGHFVGRIKGQGAFALRAWRGGSWCRFHPKQTQEDVLHPFPVTLKGQYLEIDTSECLDPPKMNE